SNGHHFRSCASGLDDNRSSHRHAISSAGEGVVRSVISAIARVGISKVYPSSTAGSAQSVYQVHGFWTAPAGTEVIAGNSKNPVRVTAIRVISRGDVVEIGVISGTFSHSIYGWVGEAD